VRLRATHALAAGLLALVACGSSSANPQTTRLTVLAASSLTKVIPAIGDLFTKVHPAVKVDFSFGGTDSLATQIEQGAPADAFAGASARFGDTLSRQHLIERPRPFCTNSLVLVVPSSNPAGITSPKDLATKDVKLVVGSETVPVGAYTRTVLGSLDATYGSDYSTRVLAHVVSNEDTAEAVLAKVETGEADAAFVYVTDARSAGSQLTAITLPAAANAVASYPIAVVSATGHAEAAREFVAFVLSGPAQALLRQAGFGPPPAS
jgi:molybdate transport system substrate-binding protein